MQLCYDIATTISRKLVQFLPVKLSGLLETFRFRTRTTTSARFDLKFFRVFSKYRHPGKLHFTIFH